VKPQPHKPPLSATQIVDEYFIENRTRLLEIAAFLDRVDRMDPMVRSRDFRMKAFIEAVNALGAIEKGGDFEQPRPVLDEVLVDDLGRAERRFVRLRFHVNALGATPDRLLQIQMILSDPTIDPLDRLDRKSAIGAFDPSGHPEARP
jgi:hypothetical protein